MNNLEILEGVVELQYQNGTWNFNAYQFGLANGLILALAIIRGKDPKLLDAPDEWLEDAGDIVPEDLVHYDTIDGKWHLFVGDKPIRPLTDDEAAGVIWGNETP